MRENLGECLHRLETLVGLYQTRSPRGYDIVTHLKTGSYMRLNTLRTDYNGQPIRVVGFNDLIQKRKCSDGRYHIVFKGKLFDRVEIEKGVIGFVELTGVY